jgi:hypothetical protein
MATGRRRDRSELRGAPTGFTDFFFVLRAYGVPVAITEWMMLAKVAPLSQTRSLRTSPAEGLAAVGFGPRTVGE